MTTYNQMEDLFGSYFFKQTRYGYRFSEHKQKRALESRQRI